MSQSTILHQADKQRFVILIDDQQALLEYQIEDEHIDFNRTYVPDALRGRGLAERLVRHGLKWAKAQQLTISASCWYVQKFLR
ncbi:GNAT family N-acetyltransferase [Shewanella algidipiscicola]|uniref:N-acetyltransferase n=1 Tax=Shewanella algidipiscicola TaxID=614070 RepID=A0ABQ4PMN9_9GAMM|nr:GNAT family N-acetyltransferase [Shewanella algidipiscicola]GIU49570.1 N-acetyltransferase [Shewanella algidipiscicola]